MLKSSGDCVIVASAASLGQRCESGDAADRRTEWAAAADRCQLDAIEAVLQPDRRRRAALVHGPRPTSRLTGCTTRYDVSPLYLGIRKCCADEFWHAVEFESGVKPISGMTADRRPFPNGRLLTSVMRYRVDGTRETAFSTEFKAAVVDD